LDRNGKVAAMTPKSTMGTDDSSYLMGDLSIPGIVPVAGWPGIVITPWLCGKGISVGSHAAGRPRRRRQGLCHIRRPVAPGTEQLKGQTLFRFILLRLIIGTILLANNLAPLYFSNHATLSIFGRILPIKKGRLGVPVECLIKKLAGFLAFA
jgi:hypothetical protein